MLGKLTLPIRKSDILVRNTDKHVVIVGAGFAGIEAIKVLSKMPVKVTIIDRNNYHQFTPLLYQVATANIENEEIIFPIRKLIRGEDNINFVQGKVTEIDRYQKEVHLEDRSIAYDYLVLSVGVRTAFHNIRGAEEYAFPMKHLSQAIELKNHILTCFEKAEFTENPERRKQMLTFVVVGAGPTGVEFSGALAELIYNSLTKDYVKLNKEELKIHLIDSGDVVLKTYNRKLSEYATKRIRKLGVIFEQERRVKEVTGNGVTLSDGKHITSNTVVWTAGIQGHDFVKEWGFEMTRNGLIKTNAYLQSTVDEDVFILGDMGQVVDNPLPALATVAIQQGDHVPKNIMARIKGVKLCEFKYKDRGTMAVIGRNAAVVQTKRLKLKGCMAWIIWSVFHIFKMGGLRNRLNIMVNWIFSYIFSEPSSTVITPTHTKPNV